MRCKNDHNQAMLMIRNMSNVAGQQLQEATMRGDTMVSMLDRYHRGDWVIYKKSKYSTQPGPRAKNVSPAQSGDKYAYTVDKFWVVADVLEDGRLVLRTRRGKEHTVGADDWPAGGNVGSIAAGSWQLKATPARKPLRSNSNGAISPPDLIR